MNTDNLIEKDLYNSIIDIYVGDKKIEDGFEEQVYHAFKGVLRWVIFHGYTHILDYNLEFNNTDIIAFIKTGIYDDYRKLNIDYDISFDSDGNPVLSFDMFLLGVIYVLTSLKLIHIFSDSLDDRHKKLYSNIKSIYDKFKEEGLIHDNL